MTERVIDSLSELGIQMMRWLKSGKRKMLQRHLARLFASAAGALKNVSSQFSKKMLMFYNMTIRVPKRSSMIWKKVTQVPQPASDGSHGS